MRHVRRLRTVTAKEAVVVQAGRVTPKQAVVASAGRVAPKEAVVVPAGPAASRRAHPACGLGDPRAVAGSREAGGRIRFRRHHLPVGDATIPLLVATDRGEPTAVFMSYDAFLELAGALYVAVDALRAAGIEP